jgi:hypothetical protein
MSADQRTWGYLLPLNRQGFATEWRATHEDTLPVQVGFRCFACCQPCGGGPVHPALKPVYDQDLGPLTRRCQSCGADVDADCDCDICKAQVANNHA